MKRVDTVMVQLQEATKGGIGQNKYAPVGEPIEVSCNVYPVDTDLITTYGLQELDTRLVVCDSWPGDLHSTIEFEGDDWIAVAPAKKYNKSFAARSVQVIIRKV